MKPVKMAEVQPASLQLFQKPAESMLGSGAAGEPSEASAGAGTALGASMGSGAGEDPTSFCGRGLWTELRSGLGSTHRREGGLSWLSALLHRFFQDHSVLFRLGFFAPCGLCSVQVCRGF